MNKTTASSFESPLVAATSSDSKPTLLDELSEMPLRSQVEALVSLELYVNERLADAECELFFKPVDTVKHTDYLKVVENPMDLGTVKKKFAGGRYFTAEDAYLDIMLIWTNCMSYVGKEYQLWWTATKHKRSLTKCYSNICATYGVGLKSLLVTERKLGNSSKKKMDLFRRIEAVDQRTKHLLTRKFDKCRLFEQHDKDIAKEIWELLVFHEERFQGKTNSEHAVDSKELEGPPPVLAKDQAAPAGPPVLKEDSTELEGHPAIAAGEAVLVGPPAIAKLAGPPPVHDKDQVVPAGPPVLKEDSTELEGHPAIAMGEAVLVGPPAIAKLAGPPPAHDKDQAAPVGHLVLKEDSTEPAGPPAIAEVPTELPLPPLAEEYTKSMDIDRNQQDIPAISFWLMGFCTSFALVPVCVFFGALSGAFLLTWVIHWAMSATIRVAIRALNFILKVALWILFIAACFVVTFCLLGLFLYNLKPAVDCLVVHFDGMEHSSGLLAENFGDISSELFRGGSDLCEIFHRALVAIQTQLADMGNDLMDVLDSFHSARDVATRSFVDGVFCSASILFWLLAKAFFFLRAAVLKCHK